MGQKTIKGLMNMFLLENTPNLVAVYVANVVALCILLTISVGCSYKLKEKSLESKVLIAMILIVAITSIVDSLVFLCDGNSGVIKKSTGLTIFINHLGNSIVYLTDTSIVLLWSAFLIIHLNGSIKKRRLFHYFSVMVITFILLMVNIFVPFIFEIDRDSVYKRVGYGYLVLMAIDIIFLADSILVYIRITAKGGMLKFFPIWGFLIPSACGIVAQSIVYGISTINVGNAIAIAGMMMSMQNDLIYTDKLTGLHNRSYLDKIKFKMEKSKKTSEYTAMMLDLNGFKLINDNYGHSVGDEALVVAANILKEAVGSYGTVVRYAGDEFVIILNTTSDALIEEVILNINRAFRAFNSKKQASYSLSIALGYSKANLKIQTIDELMNDIDKKMFAEKKKFHEEHPEFERRED